MSDTEIQKEIDKNKEFLRTSRPFSGARAVVCTWCGDAIVYADPKSPPEQIIKTMREHDLECKASPLVREITALQEKVKQVYTSGYNGGYSDCITNNRSNFVGEPIESEE